MERTLIKDLSNSIGQSVSISGWVDVARDQGKMAFFDFRDRSGIVQGIVFGKPEVLETAQKLRPEWVVRIEGIVNERPEKMRRDVQNGNIELEITGIEVLSEAAPLPFDYNEPDLNLETRFDHRPLTMRSLRDRSIFEVQATIVDAFRTAVKNRGFTEFQAPALVGEDAEGGSAVFRVDYFDDKKAYLATSPQLYKQIMVGSLERVFTIAKIFRAEKSTTTRHVSETTQMDFEMGFIKDETEVRAVLEGVIRDVVEKVREKHHGIFDAFHVPVPEVGAKFPAVTLQEALQIIGVAEAPDMEPEHERAIAEWAKKEHGSDFVFITHFPTKSRAFYTYEDPSEAPYSRGFDLLFRGLEINSGAQRIHDHDAIVARLKERGLNPEKFSFYLEAFKYGMPPHGGCSTGLDRFTMKMLGLQNVREAIPFPRDMNRIDTLLSREEDTVHE